MNKLLLSAFLFFFCFTANQIAAQNFNVYPYLQDVEPTSVYIMWETDDGGAGYVEWGISPFDLDNSIESSSISGSGSSRIHTVFISGLSSGSKYYYKAKTASGVVTPLYNFKTSPGKSSEAAIRLVAMSDMQRDFGNPNVFNQIISQGVIPTIQKPGTNDLSDMVDALLIPGDLVPTGGIYSDWENYYFDPAQSLSPFTPTYPVLGNHEYFLGGDDNYKKYFHLPENGTPGLLEEWWYKDISNVRVIGLNSNSGSADQNTQLVWLQTVLDEACADETVDFVFAELHHPFKSELWVPGEVGFTGQVINLLENFTNNCDKPSIHFFGHTHGYSRGQSRDHEHLWVNVATAGGNIDYWGEFENNDYAEFTKSQDEYGFVVLDVEAGNAPEFKLTRYGRGDGSTTQDNVVRDEIAVRRYESPPAMPFPLFPVNEEVNPNCLTLKASNFSDPANDEHQAAHWQISTSLTDFESNLVMDSWKQSENWYNDIDLQAEDDLTDEIVQANLAPNQTYHWRVRYRDQHLKWSEWSFFASFTTRDLTATTLSPNLIQNPGAESGISPWYGQIESLTSGQCGSVPVYAGARFFAVGGVCSGQSSFGQASQDISVFDYAAQIDSANVSGRLSCYMRNYDGSDIPSMRMEFFDAAFNILGSTSTVSHNGNSWTYKEQLEAIPIGTRNIRIFLEADRNSGFDNDCYFDEFAFILEKEIPCSIYTPPLCPANMVLGGTVIAGVHTVNVVETIESSAQIIDGAKVSYKAGTSILLKPDFSVEQGVEFEAVIEICQ